MYLDSWDYAYAQQELFDWMLEQRKAGISVAPDTEYADSKQFG